MPATLYGLLEALPAHFAGVAPSAAAAQQAYSVAQELSRLAHAHASTGDHSHLER